MDTRTKVKILNREFVLRGELDSEYIHYLAGKLDNRIEELKSHSAQKMDDLQLVILAALNLLDEAELNGEKSGDISEDEVINKTNRMITMLEKGIIGDTD